MSIDISIMADVDRRDLPPTVTRSTSLTPISDTVDRLTQSAQVKIGRHKKISITRSVIQRFPRALLEVAKVSEFGCSKYQVPLGDLDYLRSPEIIGDCTDALGRHLIKEITEGSVNHEDGDVLHAAQVAWNALGRLEAMLDRGIVRPAQHKLLPALAEQESCEVENDHNGKKAEE